jgi:hypothetical protein
MKNTILFLAITLIAIQASATTRTLNNAVPSPGQFTTWTSAQTASSDGDTILVQGTTYNYLTITVTKKLTIIGPGHNPTDKQNSQKAFCDNIIFSSGSNGSKVYGVETGNIYTGNNNVDSISVALCYISGSFQVNNSNCYFWLFDGNVFANSSLCINAQGVAFGNSIFQNNVINGITQAFNGGFIGYNYFNNNLFLLNDNYAIRYCNNLYFNNNIFYRAGVSSYGNASLFFTKNCSYQCNGGNAFPNGTNYENVNPLFVTSIGSGAYFSYLTNYHLQTTSTLINAGSDGTDVGIYGGNGDYDQGGVPRNPYIKTLNITGPTSINAGDSLQIYIKAKVRN